MNAERRTPNAERRTPNAEPESKPYDYTYEQISGQGELFSRDEAGHSIVEDMKRDFRRLDENFARATGGKVLGALAGLYERLEWWSRDYFDALPDGKITGADLTVLIGQRQLWQAKRWFGGNLPSKRSGVAQMLGTILPKIMLVRLSDIQRPDSMSALDARQVLLRYKMIPFCSRNGSPYTYPPEIISSFADLLMTIPRKAKLSDWMTVNDLARALGRDKSSIQRRLKTLDRVGQFTKTLLDKIGIKRTFYSVAVLEALKKSFRDDKQTITELSKEFNIPRRTLCNRAQRLGIKPIGKSKLGGSSKYSDADYRTLRDDLIRHPVSRRH